MGLKITINVLAASIAVFLWKNVIPKDSNATLDLYDTIKNNFDFVKELENDTKQSLIKEVAIIVGLYFGVNLILTKAFK